MSHPFVQPFERGDAMRPWKDAKLWTVVLADGREATFYADGITAHDGHLIAYRKFGEAKATHLMLPSGWLSVWLTSIVDGNPLWIKSVT